MLSRLRQKHIKRGPPELPCCSDSTSAGNHCELAMDLRVAGKSVVLLEYDSLAIESKGFQLTTQIVNHGLHPTNIDVNFATVAQSFQNVFLNVATTAGPSILWTAECWPKLKL